MIALKKARYEAKRRGDATRLLLPDGRMSTMGNLGDELRESDLLVVNESATIPASLPASLERTGERFELRLATREGEGQWLAVAFGAGSWRDRTEERGAAPVLHAGDHLRITRLLRARVRRLDARHERLVHVRLEGDPDELYRAGAPVQYSYHRAPLALWDAQTPLASEAWSVEAPSALFALTAARLLALKKQVRVATLLHGAGLSSTGDPALDALLPLPEPYRVPKATLEAVRETRARGGRVIAWGTSVARALEASHASGRAEGIAELRLGPERRVRVVDGIVTGFHDPGTSHFELEQAFVPRERAEALFALGTELGMLGHEYGDLVLLWREVGREHPAV